MLRFPSTLAAMFLSAASLAAQSFPLDGTWQGLFHSGPQQLRVILEIHHSPAGKLAASIYSPEQGPEPLRVVELTVSGRELGFAIPDVGATWKGVLAADGKSLHGKITQGGDTSTLDFNSASGAALWIDPRIHGTSTSIAVAPGVDLDVVDWGGSGRTLLLLTGLGNTAHIYDQFAQKLIPSFHVVGITRRGFGQSSTPSTSDPANYTADRLGDDVVAVIAAMHLGRPVLVGHSIAGEELSAVANRHPEAASAVVYLDAAFPYAFYDPAVGDYTLDLLTLQRQLSSLLPGALPVEPVPELLNKIGSELPGFQQDLGNQRSMVAFLPPPPPAAKEAELSPSEAIVRGEEKFTHVPLAALAIFAVPHNAHSLVQDDSPEKLQKAETLDRERMTQIADSFAKGVPTATVVRLSNADHYLFLSNESDVLKAIKSFLDAHP